MNTLPEITEENFMLYAAKNYRRTICLDIKEFRDDLARLKYLKKLLRKYISTGEVQERLILNHIIVFHNVFNIDAATKMCFFRAEPDLHPALKTFLIFLNFIDDSYQYTDVPTDMYITSKLQKI